MIILIFATSGRLPGLAYSRPHSVVRIALSRTDANLFIETSGYTQLLEEEVRGRKFLIQVTIHSIMHSTIHIPTDFPYLLRELCLVPRQLSIRVST